MKKLLGLLAICTLVACNESGETGVTAPPVGGDQPQAQNPQDTPLNADSIRQHVLDSIAQASLVQSSSDAVPVSSETLPLLSSSSLLLPSSSSELTPSSSSAALPVSSSTVPPKSSSSVVVDDGTIKLELWDGSLGKPHVPVGNNDGGWWYKYDDNENGGESSIDWQVDPDAKGDMTPVVDACGGVCGSFSFGGSDNLGYNGYVGFAFGFGKNDSYKGDASKLDGICVEYKATVAMSIELGLTKATETSIQNANPAFPLAKSTTLKVVDVAWDDFAQPEWYKGAKTMSGTDAAKQLSSLKFKITEEDGVSGTFAVTKVGPYGGCR